jgi:mannose-6-phosphate isomerase-like protein (cupin superfamily)
MEKLEKPWGNECWFANSPLYCGKLIFVRSGIWSSEGLYHYHKLKDETFLVIEGDLILEYYEDNIHRSLILGKYNSFHIKPGVKHRFSGHGNLGCRFIEASTEHFESDSYRCELIDGEWT